MFNLKFKKNLSGVDRAVRTLIGLYLLALVYIKAITGWWAAAAVIFSLFQFIEAYFAY